MFVYSDSLLEQGFGNIWPSPVLLLRVMMRGCILRSGWGETKSVNPKARQPLELWTFIVLSLLSTSPSLHSIALTAQAARCLVEFKTLLTAIYA